jgi:AcrR family transcriptional regulator
MSVSFRKLDKSIRYQRIIDTAVNLFRKKGYRTTSLDDVSNELGITKAALYHYVESKEELLSVIFTQALQVIFEGTQQIAALDLPPEKKLRQLIHNHITNIIIKNQSLLYVFFAEENQLPEKFSRMVRKKKREYDEILLSVIGEGIAAGVFEKVDPNLLVYTIVGMCNWIYLWYKPGIPYGPDDIANQYIRILERGFLCDKGKSVKAREDRGDPDLEAMDKGSTGFVIQRIKDLSQEMTELIDELEKVNSIED